MLTIEAPAPITVECDICGAVDTFRALDANAINDLRIAHLHPRPPRQGPIDWAAEAEEILTAAHQHMDRLGYPPAQHEIAAAA